MSPRQVGQLSGGMIFEMSVVYRHRFARRGPTLWPFGDDRTGFSNKGRASNGIS